MRLPRRLFLKTLGLAAGALATGAWLRGWPGLRLPARPATAASFSPELEGLARGALAEARALGCGYAGIRVDRSLRPDGSVASESCIVQVREGRVWGSASTPSHAPRELARTVARAAARARQGLRERDPWPVPPRSASAVGAMVFVSTKGERIRTLGLSA
jgi:hypothetical protein